MPIVKIKLPTLGEGIFEASVIKWLKKENEIIKEDEYLVEVATDKVDTEIPSPYNGVIKKIFIKHNQVIQVGLPICEIEVSQDEFEAKSIKDKERNYKVLKTPIIPQPEPTISFEPKQETQKIQYTDTQYSQTSVYLSPLVKRMVKKENVSDYEVKTIKGTGLNGRITKFDIIQFLKTRKQLKSVGIKQEPIHIPLTGEEEIVKMDRMREMIAERMLTSSKIAPHVTSFIEADVTNIVMWRNKNKDRFQEKYGEKLTYTPIFARAIVETIKDYPMINISVRGNEIIKRPYINLGMAVALPDGNLIVPVIKNADRFSLAEMARKINLMVIKARSGALSYEDVSRGTYTFSNIGGFGNLMGTPLIVQPQVAILALGVIEKKPAVITDNGNDLIAIRHKMYISHSYDHRVIDGALGGMFIKTLKEYLQNFPLNSKV